jgi:coenzyme PQQ precursor peptide PqqA
VTAEGGIIMDWEKPSFREVKMDAEINAYQDDFENIPDVQESSKEALGTSTAQ